MSRRDSDPLGFEGLFAAFDTQMASISASVDISMARTHIDMFVGYHASQLQQSAQTMFDHLDYGPIALSSHAPAWMIGPSAHDSGDILLVQNGRIVKQDRESVARSGLTIAWTAAKMLPPKRRNR